MLMTYLALSPRCVEEWPDVQPELREIVLAALDFWPKPVCKVSSINRTDAENTKVGAKSKIHVVGPPYRAVDLAGKNLDLNDRQRWAECQAIATKLNSMFEYDPDRPNMVVAYADPHGTAPHLHCQSHPRTRRRNLEQRREDAIQDRSN